MILFTLASWQGQMLSDTIPGVQPYTYLLVKTTVSSMF